MSGQLDDTICAIATPLGEGGVGIVRLSGEKALAAASCVVRLRSRGSLAAVESHRMAMAEIWCEPVPAGSEANGAKARSGRLDEALVVVMRAPHSYTGEDVVEIHCHGGPFVLQALCEALLRAGSRLGEPGEFTKRAFLNGRLDLAQAEGVLDTIRAKTEGSLRVAQAQLQGMLSREIGRLREELIRVLAHVEAGIDFTEEDIAFIEANELTASLERTREAVGRLAESCTEGRVLREGVTVAIVGRPNVGKSSLLNALLQTDRAIVAPVPGTTRDVLEEVLNIRGVPVRLVDTAGVRETMDAVEQEGVRRTRAAMEAATLLLVLVDGSVPLTDEDHALLRSGEDQKRLVLLNKCDLAPALSDNERATLAAAPGVQQVLPISAKTGEGLDGLRDAIRNQVLRPDFEAEDRPIVTRLRHRAALLKADEALAHAAGSVAEGLSGEFIAVDVRAAVEALGEITGAVTTDDILDRIFREFCIGK